MYTTCDKPTHEVEILPIITIDTDSNSGEYILYCSSSKTSIANGNLCASTPLSREGQSKASQKPNYVHLSGKFP